MRRWQFNTKRDCETTRVTAVMYIDRKEYKALQSIAQYRHIDFNQLVNAALRKGASAVCSEHCAEPPMLTDAELDAIDAMIDMYRKKQHGE